VIAAKKCLADSSARENYNAALKKFGIRDGLALDPHFEAMFIIKCNLCTKDSGGLTELQGLTEVPPQVASSGIADIE